MSGPFTAPTSEVPTLGLNGHSQDPASTSIVFERLTRLPHFKRCGSGYTASCPVPRHKHDDANPSLTFRQEVDGTVLLHCHGGCSNGEICEALGIQQRDLFPTPVKQSSGLGNIEAVYDYCNDAGELIYQVVRFERRLDGKRHKTFRPRRPHDKGGWIWGLHDTPRVLYRLQALLQADPYKPVYLPEGEKDVDALCERGLVATCNPGGAGKWKSEYSEHLRGRQVAILPDNDEPGYRHASEVAASLMGIAAKVFILELPDLRAMKPGADVSDWLRVEGNGVELLCELAAIGLKNMPVSLVTVEADAGLDAQSSGYMNYEHLNTPSSFTRTSSAKRLADVDVEEVHFIIRPYLMRSKLIGVEGDPGVGKTWACCAFATMVSTGTGMPGIDGFELGRPGNVLFCTGEDGLGDTLRPRCESMGADLTRIFAYDESLVLDEVGVLKLESEIVACRPDLVVIDPFVAFMGSKVDAYRSNEMRAMLRPLADLAKRYGCTILPVRHLTKSSKSKAIYRGQGSIDFTAACRAVVLVGCDPSDRTQRAVTLTKMNLAPDTHATGFTIENGVFKWTGQSYLTPNRLLEAESMEETVSALDEAVQFLEAVLAAGPVSSDEIFAASQKQRISDATLRRAKQQLKVKAHPLRENGMRGVQSWEWFLPPKPLGNEHAV